MSFREPSSSSASSLLNRRSLLAGFGALGAALTLPSVGLAAEPNTPVQGTMPTISEIRVGCCSWTFLPAFTAGIDPLPGIDLIGELGFDSVELLIVNPADLDNLWQGEHLTKIQATIARHGLAVSKVGAFRPFFDNIMGADQQRRNADIDSFTRVCALAQKLGASQVGFTGWSVPGTNPNIYTLKKDPTKPEAKLTMNLPENLAWTTLWERTVGVTRTVIDRAAAHGQTVCIEPHYHGIPQSAEQFLLLHAAVARPGLSCLLDTCWTTIQCAYPPLMAHMLGPHIGNVQFRDTDATTRNAIVPFGQGVVDFRATLSALQSVGYHGFISLEEVFFKADQARRDAEKFLAFMRKELERT